MLHRIEIDDGENVIGVFTWIDDQSNEVPGNIQGGARVDKVWPLIAWTIPFESMEDPRDHGCHQAYTCWFTANGYKKFRKHIRQLDELLKPYSVKIVHRTMHDTEVDSSDIVYQDRFQIALKK